MDFCVFFFFYSTIQVPPHFIWVPSPHSPSLSKKNLFKYDSSISPTILSAKKSPSIRPLIPPVTEHYLSGTLSLSPFTNLISENSMPSTSVTTTRSSSESLAQPTMSTFSSITSNKSITVPIPATESVTNTAFSIKSDAAHLSKTFTVLYPSVGFTKRSSPSSSEPHKLPIVSGHLEAITKSVAQIPPATSQSISGHKNVSTVPIVPLTPFTPTISPVNHSVSASRPHSTADGHGTPGKYDK